MKINSKGNSQVTFKFVFPKHHPLLSHHTLYSFKIQMSFTESYSTVLKPFFDDYKASTNEKERRTIVKRAADAVTTAKGQLEEEQVVLPKHLQAVGVTSNPNPCIMI